MNGVKIESVQCIKDCGQQCKAATGKVIKMLNFMNRNFSFTNKDIVLPVFIGLVIPHLEYTGQFWSPRHTK